MSKLFVGALSLIFGLVIGAMLGALLIGGATGIGVATGLGAGICSTVEAAYDEGLLTAEQVDQALNQAVANLRDQWDSEDTMPVIGSAAECERVMDDLRGVSTAD